MYAFASLTTDTSVRIELDLDPDGDGRVGTLLLGVAGNVLLESQSRMAVVSSVGGPEHVLVRVAGTSLQAQSDAVVLGTYLAPSAAVQLQSGARLTGMVYGASVQLHAGTRLTWAPVLDAFAATGLVLVTPSGAGAQVQSDEVVLDAAAPEERTPVGPMAEDPTPVDPVVEDGAGISPRRRPSPDRSTQSHRRRRPRPRTRSGPAIWRRSSHGLCNASREAGWHRFDPRAEEGVLRGTPNRPDRLDHTPSGVAVRDVRPATSGS